MIFRFNDYRLDSKRLLLTRGSKEVPVEPKVFSLLLYLIWNRDSVVSKEELIDKVWKRPVVTDAALSARIKLVRQAIGDDGKEQHSVRTYYNQGFRFIADVFEEDEERPVSVVLGPDNLDAPDLRTSQKLYHRDKPTIAILPLELQGQHLFGQTVAGAVADEIILELSRLRWLYVISRASAFKFAGYQNSLALIQQQLRTDYVLTGSLEFTGNRAHVLFEMSNCRDGHVVWMDRYHLAAEDLIALKTEIAAHVASAVEMRIPLDEIGKSAHIATENLDAWSAYHRGLNHMFRFTASDNEQATLLFEQALKSDPSFARAGAALSFTHFQTAFFDRENAQVEQNKASALAERSLELDPLDPFVNLNMGRAKWLKGELEEALTWYDRSLSLSPNYALACYNKSLAEILVDDGEKAEKYASNALLLSPLDPMKYGMLGARGLSYLIRGRYQEATDWCDQAARSPNAHLFIYAIAGLAHHMAENYEKAEYWMERVKEKRSASVAERFMRNFPFRNQEICQKVTSALQFYKV